MIEIGAGTGLTFTHYPREVSEVLAFEPEPYMRSRAERAAERASVPIRVIDGLAQALPVNDASVDVAVTSLVLCSVPNQSVALVELHRVLRPGGELRFYEHVVSERRPLARAQRVLDVAWPAFAGGCHTARDTAGAIEQAGFEPVRLRRLSFQPCICFAPVAPMVIGCARRLG